MSVFDRQKKEYLPAKQATVERLVQSGLSTTMAALQAMDEINEANNRAVEWAFMTLPVRNLSEADSDVLDVPDQICEIFWQSIRGLTGYFDGRPLTRTHEVGLFTGGVGTAWVADNGARPPLHLRCCQ